MTLEHLDTIISFVAILTGVSLLATILTQMVSSLLGLRGINLRWGIATLLEHADPKLGKYARDIAHEVLTHSVISDSMFADAESALVQNWQLASGISKDELIQILRTLAKQADPAISGPKPPEWAVALKNSLDQLDRVAADKLLAISPALQQAIPPEVGNADDIIAQLAASTEQLAGTINQWFDNVMDLVAQRFTMHTRVWTVVFSVLIAFGLNLDAFRLLTQLSSDSELRARLVASSDALTQKAGEMLFAPTNTAATGDAAMRQLTNAVSNFNSILTNKFNLWLMPDPYPTPFYSGWFQSWPHFWGIVASAALLSLGAPFWYNMLKDLSNLRPVLAQKQAAEKSDPT